MGSVVSSADNNEEFITNLCKSKHIVTPEIEQVFRMVDRVDFMVLEGSELEMEASRLEAYEDKAWRNGTYHMSAPCIYTKALEALKIQPKLSFLNIGSGTGYLSTMVGILLGPRGINRGVEIFAANVKHARERTNNFVRNSPFYDPTQFSYPEYQVGNGLLLDPQHGTYDRVYCGADVPQGYDGVMKCLLNPGGILVMPYNGALVSVTRLSETEWSEDTVLSSVSFAHLILPTEECMKETLAINFGYNIPSLQRICRLSILELVQAEKRSQLAELPLPSQLIAFLTYDGVLRCEKPKERPTSLIATGTVPEDTGSEESLPENSTEDTPSKLINKLGKKKKRGKVDSRSPFLVYGPNGMRYLFSMGGNGADGNEKIFIDMDETQRTDEDITDDTSDLNQDSDQEVETDPRGTDSPPGD